MTNNADLSIAVVGMAARFPQAENIEQYWQNIRDGRECARFFSPTELQALGYPEASDAPAFVAASAKLERGDHFDAAFFSISPTDAVALDPQHRVFLETAYHALEHAGHASQKRSKSVGVYAGCSPNTYLLAAVAKYGHAIVADAMEASLAGQPDFLSTRLAYHLNLHGPALTVQTACSTSLVAVHVACQAILACECDMALAGGVSVGTGGSYGYLHKDGGILSRDGRCRPFDLAADGTFKGEGAGVVVLKLLSRAVADGDTVHAVIRGTAVSNDGGRKATFTAPSPEGQSRAIAEAIAAAGLSPEEISYVEAHGTATKLGDPIEIQGLQQAFGNISTRCAIGSVKSNIGHTDAAAGIAGLLKVILSLKHRMLPPSLHFREENAFAPLTGTPFYVQRELSAWSVPEGRHRFAGVSSFGLGGTNAHVVVEEAPNQEAAHEEPDLPSLFVFSAKTRGALARGAKLLQADLSRRDVASAAYTYCTGKPHFEHRLALVADARGQPQSGVNFAAGGSPQRAGSVVMMFPGHGSQYIGMGAEIYAHEEVFRAEFDRCASFVEARTGWDLRLALRSDGPDRCDPFDIEFAQPLVFAFEYSLYALLRHWNVVPAGLLGHSLGEYVAACVAGAFSLEHALEVVIARGRVLAASCEGGMLAIDADVSRVTHLLEDGIWISGINSPQRCTVSGLPEPLADLRQRLSEHQIVYHDLDARHPYHTQLLAGAVEAFRVAFAGIQVHPIAVRVASNVTGEWLPSGTVLNFDYWVSHLTSAVRFSDCVKRCTESQGTLLLEVGPGHTLSRFALDTSPEAQVLSSIPHALEQRSALVALYSMLGQLWAGHVAVDWEAFYARRPKRRVPTPLYPFERTRYALDLSVADGGHARMETRAELMLRSLSDDGSDAPEALPADSVEVPTSETEAYLCSLWQSLLGLPRIGVHDDFFELGGHSLLATRMTHRLAAEKGIAVPLRAIFAARTVSSFAKVLDEFRGGHLAQMSYEQPVPRTGRFPLSLTQQRLWYLDLLLEQKAVYNLPTALRVTGSVSVLHLRAALGDLVARHSALRCRFELEGDIPVQVVQSDVPAPLEVIDLRNLDTTDAQARIAVLVDEHANRRFLLDAGSLFSVRLILVGTELAVLCVNMHHIISDAWSASILIRDLVHFYKARVSAVASGLPPLRVQYSDFAVSQRTERVAQRLRLQLEYWREQLDGAPGLLNLPTRQLRPAVQTHNGESLNFRLSADEFSLVMQIAGRFKATPFMVLEAAFALVLGRYAGQDDVCIGVPVAGRPSVELEEVIGFFVNTVVLRTKLQRGDSFKNLLEHTKAAALAAFANQEVPFEQLVEELQPARSLGHSPFFQVLFAFQNVPKATLEVPGIAFEVLPPTRVFAKYDISIYLTEDKEGIALSLVYNTDLFDRATIERLSSHYRCLLRSACVNPDEPVAALEMMSSSERGRVLANSGSGARPYPNETIHRLFERVAVGHGPSLAVVSAARSLTYSELNAQANQLAHLLVSRGVRAEARVGICLHRSPELVVTALAVLKVGCAYVALDPSYPRARLALILEDSAPALIIAHDDLCDRLPGGTDVLLVDAELLAMLDGLPAGNLEAAQSPEALAYVMFTSGSTGRPKGVAIQHRGVVNYLSFLITEFGIGSGDRILQLTSFAFDPSVRDIFGPLLSGACLELLEDEEARDPLAIGEHIRCGSSTLILSVTPSLLSAIAMAYPGGIANTLRAVFTCGEVLRALHVDSTERIFGKHVEIINQYGPTEITMVAAFARVVDRESIPIGRPVANTEVLVLDAERNLVPDGVTGEIYLAGAGLSPGYVGSSSDQNSRFVPNPHSALWTRMYRTGDRGWVGQDGSVFYAGRADQQVKLRGFRIELEEIEGRLRVLPGVSGALVQSAGTDEKQRLVAYVVPESEGVLRKDSLDDLLREVLPSYMVPEVIEIIPEFPRLPNGKVDRAKLTSLTTQRSRVVTDARPATATEQRVRDAWLRALGGGEVGLDDDFFSVGGHSLLAVRVMLALNAEFGVRLRLIDVLRRPTVTGIAKALDGLRTTEDTGFLEDTLRQALAELDGADVRDALQRSGQA